MKSLPRFSLVRIKNARSCSKWSNWKQTYFSSNQRAFYNRYDFVDFLVQWSQWGTCSTSYAFGFGFGFQERHVICQGNHCDKMPPPVTRACQTSPFSVDNMAENNLQGLFHGSKNDQVLANHNFENLLVSSTIECALYCVRIPQCSSINIAKEKAATHGFLLCQLNNATVDSSEPKDLISTNGCNYYNIMSRHLGN